MKTLIILSVFLLAVASASITRSPAAKLRDLLPESRIVGGSLASAGQFPYQVGLSLSDGKSSWWCGGSIIAANWIITAAHCTDGANRVVIYAGTSNVNNLDSTAQIIFVFGAGAMTIHSQYNRLNLNNDISVIRLSSPLKLSNYIKPVQLASRSDVGNSFQGKTAVASGWGKVNDASNSITNQLRYVNMVVENQKTCNSYYFPGIVTDGVICTNTARGQKSTCNGDSGGPLVYNGRLIGVTSFVSARGCQSGGPGGFTRVTHYLDWVKQITGLNV